jgi:hypothetical protein
LWPNAAHLRPPPVAADWRVPPVIPLLAPHLSRTQVCLDVRAALFSSRARTPGAFPRVYIAPTPRTAPSLRPNPSPSSRRAPPNPRAAAAVSRPSAALPSPRRSASLQGKERDGVACCRPEAPHRRDGVAGVCAATVRPAAPCAVAAAPVSALVPWLFSRACALRPGVILVVNGAP